MIGEINIAGVFVSPLLLCIASALIVRILVSKLLEAAGFYRLVWQKPLFDTALFIILIGGAFVALRLATL